MRRLYKWYVPPSEAEIERVWTSGILTVDANVLLDLYRYHEQTRAALLAGLSQFRGRAWLSNQACREFVRNRTTVIAGAAKTFKDAAKSLDVLNANVTQTRDTLRGYRLVPQSLAEDLFVGIQEILDTARKRLSEADDAYPNYFHMDPVLDKVLSLFEGAVGSDPSAEELARLNEEGAKRRAAHIPPGFKDEDKEDDAPNGDFILWSQVLGHAKERKLPVILVTSERKEDWWEKHSGRRVGPRPELLREAEETAGQRILLYETEYFVELVAKRRGLDVANEVVEEIRDIGRKRDLPAVSATQRPDQASASRQKGQLVVHLHRSVANATGSGRLVPRMNETPQVWASLRASPEGAPRLQVSGGSGTNFDFNVHFRPIPYGERLPLGDYVFDYTAQCEVPNTDPVGLVSSAIVEGAKPEGSGENAAGQSVTTDEISAGT